MVVKGRSRTSWVLQSLCSSASFISAVLSSVFGFRFLGASCATKKALGIPPLNASPPQERERGAEKSEYMGKLLEDIKKDQAKKKAAAKKEAN